MRWHPLLIAPLALAHTGCSSWLRAGPQGRVLDERAAVEGKVTLAGGVESVVFPLSLSAGVTPDDGEDVSSLSLGGEGITPLGAGPWGYVMGTELVGELTGPTGTSLIFGGGPYLELDSEGRDATVLYLNLNAGPGLSGDMVGFTGGVSLTLGTLHVGVFNIPSGRVLRGKSGALTAELRERCDWLDPAPLVDLPLRERRRRGRHWLSAALDEHASIVAFEQLAAELSALGAPRGLVEAAESARRDEIQHARLCFSIASAYLGRGWGPGQLDVPCAKPPSLARLAYESVVDGCAGEGTAALVARSRSRRARDPFVRRALNSIAADEARHAALGARTLRWCLEVGGDDVLRAAARGCRDARARFGMRVAPAA